MSSTNIYRQIAATGLLTLAFTASAQITIAPASRDIVVEQIPKTALKNRPLEMFQDADGNRLAYLPSNGTIQALHILHDAHAALLKPEQLPPPADIGNGWYFAAAGSNIFREAQTEGSEDPDVPGQFRVRLTLSNKVLMISPTAGFPDTVTLRNDGYFSPGASFNAYDSRPSGGVLPLEGVCNSGIVQFTHIPRREYDLGALSFYNVKNARNAEDRGIVDAPFCSSKKLIWRQAP